METILISGGNGFLGSYLAEKTLIQGMEVTVVDDLSNNKEINVPKEVIFRRMKIEDFSDKKLYDYIVHLAAMPSPEDYIKNPVSNIMSNSIGTFEMLDIAVKGNAIFMYTSSSEVYGDSQIIPTPETYFGYVNLSSIRSCYDEGKSFSEAFIMTYYRQYWLDTGYKDLSMFMGPGYARKTLRPCYPTVHRPGS